MPDARIDRLSITTLRMLALDMVQTAKSGHPGNAARRRAGGVRDLGPVPQAQSRRSALGRPRPLRPLLRPRLRDALRPAPPGRIRPAARTAQAVPADGQPLPGPPGSGPDAGRRGDRRAARTGHLERRRHGHRRAAPRRGLQSARTRDRQPPHVRDVLRRRHDGRRRLRGRLARRVPQAGQARRAVRRQRHQHRGAHAGAGVQGGRRRALRGVRLARAQGGRPERHRGGRAGAAAGRGEVGPAHADLGAQHDRVRRARGEHRQSPRRADERGPCRPHEELLRVGLHADVPHPGRGAGELPQGARPRARGGGGVDPQVRGVPQAVPGACGAVHDGDERPAARRLGEVACRSSRPRRKWRRATRAAR